ncbi:hypothetical protein [Lysobacter capsici]|nr:hypothetical protein [Lysobacter capsici]WND83118.1 hypothetical protein RJ610_12515 [Lysobacter capsici]WND88317.1 hypothetical protein RJ609_12525 [Lysobacter capsici]
MKSIVIDSEELSSIVVVAVAMFRRDCDARDGCDDMRFSSACIVSCENCD